MKTFGRGTSWLCRVFLHMIDFVHDLFEGKIYMAESVVGWTNTAELFRQRELLRKAYSGFLTGLKLGFAGHLHVPTEL
ncbi:LOW QUALITY PROTEIN: hypothetical protein PHMEG_00023132 [Phytophthora megakarya]|uniref:Uncharacterized protein n=1 Tax=Phytophthora megakarya TaxID=4795 RepID=A0A225VIU7_9STRA|nr:LOW QUALITY PROTEIN: hypothetical protein PHMEG_00023132 [Phytophthora megakarya]